MKIRAFIYGGIAAAVGLCALYIVGAEIASNDHLTDHRKKAVRDHLLSYIENNAHDPGSVEILEITKERDGHDSIASLDVLGVGAGVYRVKWRGKNALGALVLREDIVSFLEDRDTPLWVPGDPAFAPNH